MPTVNIAPYIRNQYFTDNGVPLAGGLLNCYNGGSAGGTGDRKDTYSDAAGTVLNANPIVLDAAGRAKIYLKSGPYLFVLTDSNGSVIWSEDGVTAFSATTLVNVMTDLKALVGGSSSIVRTLGRLTVNDGGGWWYYWSASSSATDDGGMVIQPSSLPATGRWIGFVPENRELNLRVYGAVCDGTTDVSAELTLCNAYCAANGCTIVIDSNVYEATDVDLVDETGALLTPVKLLPNAQFRYSDSISPTPTIRLSIPIGDATRHFNCIQSRVPNLITPFIYPEWFGESYITDPITSAAMSSLTYGGTVWLSDAAISSLTGNLSVPGVLTATGVSNLNGGATVANTLTAQGTFLVATHTPANASASGVAGRIAWDADYIYICTATNTWKRVAISTWS